MRPGQSGCYGKIPQRGDFITRSLDAQLVTLWDDWLQEGLGRCRERHGEGWIDHYMVSPVWRFVAGPGTLDQACWCGVMIPSVDRVGRYFPFTVLAHCGQGAPLFAMETCKSWFDAAEVLALDCLADEFDPAALDQRLSELPPPVSGVAPGLEVSSRPGLNEASRQYQLGATFSSLDGVAAIGHDALSELCPAHSVWWSPGSAHVAASLLVACGLPTAEEFVAMLDGEFAQCGWADGGWLGEDTGSSSDPERGV